MSSEIPQEVSVSQNVETEQKLNEDKQTEKGDTIEVDGGSQEADGCLGTASANPEEDSTGSKMKVNDIQPHNTLQGPIGLLHDSSKTDNDSIVQEKCGDQPGDQQDMECNGSCPATQPAQETELPVSPQTDLPLDEQSNLSEATSGEPSLTPVAGVNEESQSMEAITRPAEPADDQDRCYCGKERNLNVVELQCSGCLKWFHEACISIPAGKCMPFMLNYNFVCKMCSTSGSESFTKRQSNFIQMCATAIANLIQQSLAKGKPRTMFSKDKEIIPFIEKHWEAVTTMPRRIKQTWHTTVYRTMVKDTELFTCEERVPEGASWDNYPMFGLVMQDLYKIGPNFDSPLKCGQTRQFDMLMGQSGFSTGKGRSAKRKFPGDSQSSSFGKKAKSDLIMPKLPPHGYPLEHPFNKDGYRYLLAEPDPHAPFRQEFDESSDWAGKPIPGWLYRKLVPTSVLLAMHDRAPQVRIGDDRLSVTGDKGYCMVRATHGVKRGTWYFECTIDDMPEGSATRLGWSQGLGNLQAPLGYDHFSYSWRSRKGTKFHQSRGYHYSDEGYGQGDTLGFLIHLPPANKSIPLPTAFKDRPLVKFKSYLYYEEKDEVQDAIKDLVSLPGSKMVYYKNGKNKGTAWENIFVGEYFPAVSMYKNCTVNLNFGPSFKYPPTDHKFRAVYEAAHDTIIEHTVTDLLFLVENWSNLRLDTL